MGLVERIKTGLAAHLRSRGLSQIEDAVGAGVGDWV
jgi:dihydroorotate dehydrogenase